MTSLPPLIAIVAMASNRVIGKDGTLPWRLPEDLKFFKKTTLGHPILMGRRTFESLGKPLPGRRNIVLSRTMPEREGVDVIRSLDELAGLAIEAEKVFVIGGAQLFEALLPHCEGMYLTWVEHPYEGDTWLPPFESLFAESQVIGRSEGMEFRYYERLKTKSDAELMALASKAAECAYAPYSKAQVGCVVVAKSGALYTGCNVENASYGLTICAERNAIFAGVAAEGPSFRLDRIAVVALGLEFPPCGACRQVIAEFSDDDASVVFLREGRLTATSIRELLPSGFRLQA